MREERLRERPSGQWWQSTEPMVEASYEIVRRFGVSALMRAGASQADAEFLLSMSMDKAVQGDHARGLDGLPGLVRAAMAGQVSLQPSIEILRETPATALVDGDPKVVRSLLCRAAMDLAIEKARTQGVAWVSVRHPAGILTAHLQQAVDAGMIGMVMTQSYPMVAPHGGFRPMLGNAPIGFGIPAGEHDPIIFDAALTQTSASGVKLAATQGQTVPEGFLLDERGEPTTDPTSFPAAGHYTHDSQLARGTLLPLGSSHKAYGLIFVVTLLTALLAESHAPWEAGAILGGAPADPGERYGSTYMALDPAAFMPLDEFRRRVDSFIDDLKASPTRSGVQEILYPGERSQRLKRERRSADRFLLPVSHYQGLRALGQELGLDEILPLA
jgi:LDH2 family malate/lactate/ureidoglycolate dehydrogenase